MSYRPCIYRQSQLGIFQCEKHFFQHAEPNQYDELYEFCLSCVPDRFCPHLDFGFNLEGEPKIYINCTHTYKARPLKSFSECEECDFPDKQGSSLG
jgi:hypothetical protein